MDKKAILATALGLSGAALAAPEAVPQRAYGMPGRNPRVGQYIREEKDEEGRVHFVDRSERIRFDQSKYIPGNGAHHRLGKRGG